MKTITENIALSLIKPEQIFPRIANERGSVWLDSSMQLGDKGRYSFVARRPVAEIIGTVKNLDDSLSRVEKLCLQKKLCAIGYLSYESGLRFLDIETTGNKQLNTPLLHFYFYESVLRFDNKLQSCLATNPQADDYSDILDRPMTITENAIAHPSRVIETVSKENYLRRVGKIKEHIREGDIYQANYSCRFDVESSAEPFSIYQRLRNLNPAPYAAYLNFGDYQILSSSPERMFKKESDFVTSCPIKGTVPSGNDSDSEKIQIEKLLNSAKDKAELLMIVDLMRNDIGKVAKTGTVEVNRLFTAERFSSVIHLVADISAELNDKANMADIFRALIPGGSITGAPKKRAVEILQTYETTPRGVYTGCIGYIDNDCADFNIAIRTIIHRAKKYYVHAGGGIVADSDPESEYQEMHLKARNLFRALGVNRPNFYA